jgi:hypothetical protein
MSDDRLRVLEMIQNKTITAAEGADLLKALDKADENLKPVAQKNAFKMFKIKVISADGDKVNVQIPVEFAKIALTSGKGFMKFDQIDDLNLDIDAILNMIETGMLGELVNVESADGDLVKIVIE